MSNHACRLKFIAYNFRLVKAQKLQKQSYMKKILFAIMLAIPFAANAQSNWESPTINSTKTAATKKDKKVEKKKNNNDPKYLAGAVPVVDGKVQWTLDLEVAGKTAEQIYETLYGYMEELTSSDNQLKGSQIAIVNKAEHSVVVNVKEWLLFKKTAIMIDRAATSYNIFADCSDGHLQVKLTRVVFDYTENTQGQDGIYKAEEWITDEEALNKARTKMYPGVAKFRRKMIDRKDEIFNQISNLWK